MNVERLYCGNGEGMFVSKDGEYVSFSDYEKLSNDFEQVKKDYEDLQSKLGFQIEENKIVKLNFGEAIEALKKGRKVCRKGWNGKGMYLRLVHNDKYSLDVESFEDLKILSIELISWVGMKTADNKFVPWLASQTDILAEDWEII